MSKVLVSCKSIFEHCNRRAITRFLRQILLFPPDKLRACVSLANKLHTEAIEPANGKLQMMIILMSPPGAPLSPGFIIFYDGPEEKARSLAKPVFDLGPTKAMGGMTTYAKCTVIPPGLMPSGFDRYAASSAHMDYPLNEDLVLDVFDRYAQTVEKYGSQIQPSNCALDLRDYRKVASVPADATAYSARYNTALVVPNLRWQDPKLDQTMRSEASALTAYIREKVREAGIKAGVQTDGQRDVTAIYANVSGGAEKSKSVYGSNLPRLQALKKKYDPNLVWDKWYPIIPS